MGGRKCHTTIMTRRTCFPSDWKWSRQSSWYPTRRECLLCLLESQWEELATMEMGNKYHIGTQVAQRLAQGRHSRIFKSHHQNGNRWATTSNKNGRGEQLQKWTEIFILSQHQIFLSVIGADVTKPGLALEHWIQERINCCKWQRYILIYVSAWEGWN